MAMRMPVEQSSEEVKRYFASLRSAPTTPAPTAPAQLAKIPTDVSKIMPRQALAPSHGTIPTHNFIRNESTGNTVSMNSDGSMRWSDSAGMPISRPEGGMRSAAPGGAQQAGNMDVTFDPSVSQGARRAFMTDPVAPTAQMDRYDATQRNKVYMPRPESGSSSAGGLSIGEAVVDGIRQRRSQFQSQQDLATRGQDLGAEEAGMRNRLLSEHNASLAPLEAAQGQAAQMEVNSALRAQKLFNAINNEPDAGKKALLMQQYKLLTGQKDSPDKTYSGTEESMTPEGIRQTAYVLEKGPDGQWVKRVPQEGGTAAEVPTEASVKLMMKNKGNAQHEAAYIKRFGKLPY